MRQIKASEVKPGMTIRWEQDGAKIQLPVHSVEAACSVAFIESQWCLGDDTTVTVLSEPTPAQPEEPTEFGAKVRVRKGRFVRLVEGDAGFRVWFEEGTESWWTWDDLCEMGPVTVVPDQGWTVPADAESAPEVPEKLHVWPENDEHLREHKWRDNDGDTVQYIDGAWRYLWSHAIGYAHPHVAPLGPGPWTRKDD